MIDYLLYIARKGGMFSTTTISTLSASSELRKSQQSLSRIFMEMERKGLITRKPSYQGLEVALTEKGRAYLYHYYLQLQKLFEKKELVGKVRTGVGEGSWYIHKYSSRIKKALDFVPYEGTLNLEVGVEDKNRFISSLDEMKVEGFSSQGRSFGWIKLYKIRINNKEEGAIVVPERARHPPEIVEIIAPIFLRKKFRLRDGSRIKITA